MTAHNQRRIVSRWLALSHHICERHTEYSLRSSTAPPQHIHRSTTQAYSTQSTYDCFSDEAYYSLGHCMADMYKLHSTTCPSEEHSLAERRRSEDFHLHMWSLRTLDTDMPRK